MQLIDFDIAINLVYFLFIQLTANLLYYYYIVNANLLYLKKGDKDQKKRDRCKSLSGKTYIIFLWQNMRD